MSALADGTDDAVSVPRPSPGTSRRWVRRLLRLLAMLVLFAGAAVALLWQLTPSVGDLQQRVTDRLAARGTPDPQTRSDSSRVVQALIATEDSRFYQHHGIDPIGAVRGVAGSLAGNPDAGGATLDQQLAKVIYTPEQTGVLAKAEQLVLALKIDKDYPKNEILRTYLAAVYFGHGYYGLSAAARGYFGRDPADLTWAQASMLAGLVAAPSAYDPLQHLDLAKTRQQHVLDRLVATGVLSSAEVDAAFAAPLGLRQ
ncbi:MAG TPA: biosynthetic peptidoglycan transglycosylase [Pseudonocardiaceae bacterium]